MADDIIDHGAVTQSAVDALRGRLDRIYTGRPLPHSEDRALARVVEHYAIPRALPEELLEGFAWEIEGRSYHTMEDLHAYSARVAGTVGVMVTIIMGRQDKATLSRACDLGVAMQLTNIARDVGEDARRGKLYLPRQWMCEAGLDPDQWLAKPNFSPTLGTVVRRLLDEADRLYQRAEGGIGRLPGDCRIAIQTARLVYADIGRVIAASGYDSVTARAVTSGRRKTWLALRAAPALLPRVGPETTDGVATVPAARFLIDAALGPDANPGLATHLEASLERTVDRLTESGCPPRLARAIRYAVFPAGNRLRPTLCYGVAEALGHSSNALVDHAAVAIELLHCASLVQDDLPAFDNAGMRRGRPSLHRVFGEDLAILASDALIMGAFEELALAPLAPALNQRRQELTRLLARAAGSRGGLVAGQGWEAESDVAIGEYHRAKTAALFEAASAAGALAVGVDPAPWAPLGRWIGMVYQVADDFADQAGAIGLATDAALGRPNVVDQVGPEEGRNRLEEYAARAIASIPPCAGRAQLRRRVSALLDRFAEAAQPAPAHASRPRSHAVSAG
jgi:phytoene synthase